MNYVGFDYSVKSPAMCVLNGDFIHINGKFEIDKCFQFYGFFENTMKNENVEHVENLYIDFEYDKWDVERYYYMSRSFMVKLSTYSKVAIEGYSYMPTRSRSIVSLAENMGILKLGLCKINKKPIIFQPSTIKKFATDNGKAKKIDMIKAADEMFGFNFMVYFCLNLNSPLLSDLIDSLWVTLLLYTHCEKMIKANPIGDLEERYKRVNFLEKVGD